MRHGFAESMCELVHQHVPRDVGVFANWACGMSSEARVGPITLTLDASHLALSRLKPARENSARGRG
jgi:hypothetical protein